MIELTSEQIQNGCYINEKGHRAYHIWRGNLCSTLYFRTKFELSCYWIRLENPPEIEKRTGKKFVVKHLTTSMWNVLDKRNAFKPYLKGKKGNYKPGYKFSCPIVYGDLGEYQNVDMEILHNPTSMKGTDNLIYK